ncbi:hypothetical protein J19TS2_29350 [Cohnella xylanilytica]|nr:hypothetical protein J19TS2_29350 [Cohnella xylanilytica]
MISSRGRSSPVGDVASCIRTSAPTLSFVALSVRMRYAVALMDRIADLGEKLRNVVTLLGGAYLRRRCANTNRLSLQVPNKDPNGIACSKFCLATIGLAGTGRAENLRPDDSPAQLVARQAEAGSLGGGRG